jgi:hypothetical protein
MARTTSKNWQWINAKVKEGSFLEYLKNPSEAPQGAKVIEDSGKHFVKTKGYTGKITGFGILAPEQLDFRLLEVVLTDEQANEKFTFSVPFQSYSYSLNLIQRLYSVMQDSSFEHNFEVSPYEFKSKDDSGKEYTNKGFTVKNETFKAESYKFTSLPELTLLKPATAKAKAVYDSEPRMDFLEKKVIEIQKAIHQSREQSAPQQTAALPPDLSLEEFETFTAPNDLPFDKDPF